MKFCGDTGGILGYYHFSMGQFVKIESMLNFCKEKDKSINLDIYRSYFQQSEVVKVDGAEMMMSDAKSQIEVYLTGRKHIPPPAVHY